jgi:hypothetical protein
MNQPTSVSLTPNLPSPQPEGTELTFTAEATGGTGSYEYRFWAHETGGVWKIVQDYSSSPHFTWTATDDFDWIGVWARNAGSKYSWQVYNVMKFRTDMNPPTSVTLTPNLFSPQPKGTVVTFTAEATGGSGNYDYRFGVHETGGNWTIVQDYSSSSNFTWRAADNIDLVGVWARNRGSQYEWQAYELIEFSTN